MTWHSGLQENPLIQLVQLCNLVSRVVRLSLVSKVNNSEIPEDIKARYSAYVKSQTPKTAMRKKKVINYIKIIDTHETIE